MLSWAVTDEPIIVRPVSLQVVSSPNRHLLGRSSNVKEASRLAVELKSPIGAAKPTPPRIL